MNLRFFAMLAICLATGALAARAADLPGSKDPPDFKRFEGSEIIHFQTRPYDQYFLAKGEGSIGVGFEKEDKVEGAIDRVVYKGPAGSSSLEIFRNYEQMLSDLGFEETFKLDSGTINGSDFQERFYFQAGYLARKAHEDTPFQDSKNQYYLTASKTVDGQTVMVAVLVVESGGLSWSEPSVKDPISIDASQPVVGLDVVTTKQVNYRMADAKGGDLPGSKDPSGFKRFEGSQIIHYQKKSYDQYFLARGEGSIGVGFEKEEKIEGGMERVVYKGPPGSSSLEIFRNYEKMLSDLGFEESFKLDAGAFSNPLAAPDFQERFFFQAGYLARKAHEDSPFQDSRNQYYLTASKTVDGQTVTVAVFVVESTGLSWNESGVKAPIPVDAAQPVIGVDVITAKQINYRMVEVKADDMAKALSDAGKIDLYGILFDIDKTDLKPASKNTLDEVAKLLRSDPTLRLEVAGHTDNTGSAAHNMELSAGRAAAVVNALVATYGIDKSRLEAKGYGDTMPVAPNDTDEGRAKNRRVELRKM